MRGDTDPRVGHADLFTGAAHFHTALGIGAFTDSSVRNTAITLATAGIPHLTPEKAEISCLAAQPLTAIGVGAALSDGNTFAGMTTVAFRRLKALRAAQVAKLPTVITGNTSPRFTPLRSSFTVGVGATACLREANTTTTVSVADPTALWITVTA